MDEFNYQNRRDFLKYMLGTAAAFTSLSALPNDLLLKKDLVKLTILYTNDVHSRIDPFPENDPKYANKGGCARRAALIKDIRKKENNILLLDAGDIFQGTPYFNLYQGELEYKLMSEMGYDACTIGNHDFDLGMDNIVKQMPHAKFSFINANYNFADTPLHDKIIPYKLYEKQGIKIGVLGIGIELAGLVEKKLYGNTQYNNPLIYANAISKLLKKDLDCDYVICLSHLGYKYEDKKISDITLAEQSQYIDLIIGGHTHTFLDAPVKIKNKIGKEVFVTQVGWSGIWLGQLDVVFSNNKKIFSQNSNNRKI